MEDIIVLATLRFYHYTLLDSLHRDCQKHLFYNPSDCAYKELHVSKSASSQSTRSPILCPQSHVIHSSLPLSTLPLIRIDSNSDRLTARPSTLHGLHPAKLITLSVERTFAHSRESTLSISYVEMISTLSPYFLLQHPSSPNTPSCPQTSRHIRTPFLHLVLHDFYPSPSPIFPHSHHRRLLPYLPAYARRSSLCLHGNVFRPQSDLDCHFSDKPELLV